MFFYIDAMIFTFEKRKTNLNTETLTLEIYPAKDVVQS